MMLTSEDVAQSDFRMQVPESGCTGRAQGDASGGPYSFSDVGWLIDVCDRCWGLRFARH